MPEHGLHPEAAPTSKSGGHGSVGETVKKVVEEMPGIDIAVGFFGAAPVETAQDLLEPGKKSGGGGGHSGGGEKKPH